MNKLIMIIAVSTLALSPLSGTYAQSLTGAQNNGKDPIEITADQSLEWLRNDQTFIARKNAKAKQGDVSVSATTLTANYRDGNGSGMEIYKMTAEGNVVLSSRESHAYGDKAIYEVDQGKAIMTGNDLRMTSTDQTVTARDQFEYWTNDGRVIAVGDAKIIRPKVGGGTDTLRADKISALMKENEKGQRVLHSMEAIGNVVITTPTEVVTGAYGIYKTDTNKAELTGDVVIKRGPNVLQGKKAEVDLTTNTSRMFGDEKTGGQVRGVFYPNSEKTPKK